MCATFGADSISIVSLWWLFFTVSIQLGSCLVMYSVHAVYYYHYGVMWSVSDPDYIVYIMISMTLTSNWFSAYNMGVCNAVNVTAAIFFILLSLYPRWFKDSLMPGAQQNKVFYGLYKVFYEK